MKDLLFAFNCVEDGRRHGLLGECACPQTVELLHQALYATGHQVWPINVQSPEQLTSYLQTIPQPVLAFVYAEGFLDRPETLWNGEGQGLLREILAQHRIPSTHSTPEVMQLCRHKHLTSTRLAAFGLPVPPFFACTPSRFLDAGDKPDLDFPLFVKPASGGASMGVDESSLVFNHRQLLKKIEELYHHLGDLPVMIETYLPGREYTVGVIGNDIKYVLPPMAFSPNTGIRDLEKKRNPLEDSREFLAPGDPRWHPMVNLALATFDALKASDVVRIDLKEDKDGNLYIIDVNGTPSLSAHGSLVAMAEHIDINYTQLISIILKSSYERHRLEAPGKVLELAAEAIEKLVSYATLVA